MSSFSRFSAGDLMARYMSISTTGVRLFDMAPAIVLFLNVVIFSYLLFMYSWKLGAVEMMALLTIVISVQFSASYQKRKAHSMEKTDRHLQSATMAGIRSMETIKSAGAEQGFYQRWDAIYTEALNARVVATRQMIWISAVPILVMHMSNALLLCLGTWFILRGELTAGMLLASQGFMTSMLYPVTRLTNVMQEVYKAHSILERQEEVLDVKTVVDDENVVATSETTGTITKLTGDIELRDVTFGYDRSQPPLISHLSLHIKAGEQVAFVGKSGCGKSTVAMLIAGLYEPWEGEVLIDGKPVSQIDRMTLTGSLGFVGQDITLFEGTVADNIKMWDKSIEDFVRWSLNYDLWCKMEFFGDAITQANRYNGPSHNQPKSLLEDLPQVFSREDVKTLYIKKGMDTSKVAQTIRMWKHRNLIIEQADGTYKQLRYAA